MIEINGLTIDRNTYGQVVVTFADNSTMIAGDVQTLLLYEILNVLIGLVALVKPSSKPKPDPRPEHIKHSVVAGPFEALSKKGKRGSKLEKGK